MPGGSARAAPAAPRPSPAPMPVNHAPPPVPAQSVHQGSLPGAVAEGMALGFENAAAHRVVDSVVGPRTIQHETVTTASAPALIVNSLGSDACNVQLKAFQDCLNGHGNGDSSRCQLYMEMLAECRKNAGATVSA